VVEVNLLVVEVNRPVADSQADLLILASLRLGQGLLVVDSLVDLWILASLHLGQDLSLQAVEVHPWILASLHPGQDLSLQAVEVNLQVVEVLIQAIRSCCQACLVGDNQEEVSQVDLWILASLHPGQDLSLQAVEVHL